jgi:hypothetical protein
MNLLILPLHISYTIFYYLFYICLWKELIKRVIRLVTGKHEIQRNVLRYKNFFKLSNSKLFLKNHIT